MYFNLSEAELVPQATLRLACWSGTDGLPVSTHSCVPALAEVMRILATEESLTRHGVELIEIGRAHV